MGAKQLGQVFISDVDFLLSGLIFLLLALRGKTGAS